MAASAFVALLTGVIFARWLKPEGFGIYSLVASVVSFGASVGAAGMDYTVARYVSFYLGSDARTLIRTLIGYGLRWSLTLSAAAAVVIFSLLRNGRGAGARVSELTPFAFIILLTIPALAVQSVVLQAILALQAVKLRVLLEKLVHPLLRLSLPFALLFLIRDRVMAAVAGLFVSSLALTALAAIGLRSHLRGLPTAQAALPGVKAEWRRYAVPYVLFSLQNFLSAGMGVDILLVSALASVSDSGVYAACFRFTLALTLARAGMDYAFGPQVGQLFGRSELAAIHDLYRTSSAIGLAWTLPLSVILVSFSHPLMATLFGAPYARGGRALAVLAVGFAIDGSAGCYNTLLAMIGRPWLVFMNGFVGGVSAVGLCLLLIPRYGMVGAAAAVTIARSAATALGTFEIWQLHGFHPFSRSSLKLLAAGLSAGILGYLCRPHLNPSMTPSLTVLGLGVGLIVATYILALRMTRFSIEPV